jgi:TIR domain
MKIRPFLSHKRQDALVVARLRDTLRLYGAGGWKDTEDLRLGASTREEIRRAILEKTGGFIWWGTRRALSSEVINELEIPTALERAHTESLYPLVPSSTISAPARTG